METVIVTRLASAYQVPITESLIKAWLDALEVVDDLQLAHSVHQMFLRSEIARHPSKKGWMPTPEEFMEAYKLERETRKRIAETKKPQLEVVKNRIPMPKEFKEAMDKLTQKWSTKQTK
jgi:hypothetical protein